MTVTAQPHRDPSSRSDTSLQFDDRPVEFWPTALIRSALETGDVTVWQRIVVAIKRDPYGRTARQVEEVLEHSQPYGISKALTEVLVRARNHLEANERAEAARHVRLLLDRSGLGEQEFASRIGVLPDEFKLFDADQPPTKPAPPAEAVPDVPAVLAAAPTPLLTLDHALADRSSTTKPRSISGVGANSASLRWLATALQDAFPLDHRLRWNGPLALLIALGLSPWAVPKAGMDSGLWPLAQGIG